MCKNACTGLRSGKVPVKSVTNHPVKLARNAEVEFTLWLVTGSSEYVIS